MFRHAVYADVDVVSSSEWAEIRVTKPISPGQEVLNSYGHLSNVSLLTSYGFTHDHNPADYVYISAGLLRATCALSGVSGGVLRNRTQWCVRTGLLHADRYCIHVYKRFGLPAFLSSSQNFKSDYITCCV